jgi:hypothetical protein
LMSFPSPLTRAHMESMWRALPEAVDAGAIDQPSDYISEDRALIDDKDQADSADGSADR